ncbi:hypothetical protein ACSBOX_17870 [Arthrobacter sp. KN11-1C]|uniref:hypothetical protein n=1 Tax=Arthrobacter sp. KN11-1C TaxID=3445774 RepID=UPI003FA009DA
MAAGPEAAARELQDIMDAYAVLGDPVQRAAYDRHRQPSPSPAPAPRPPDPSRAAPHRHSGPALIIGPVRWEDPGRLAPGQQAPGQRAAGRQITGLWDLVRQGPDRAAAEAEEPPRPGYRILWIRR